MALTVVFEGGTRFTVDTGRHVIVTDQPFDDGGMDAGPSPVELFVASLASCIGYFVARYCHRHGIAAEGLWVDADWSYAERPHRIGAIKIRLYLPDGVTPQDEERIKLIAEGCTVHRTLEHPPTIRVALEKRLPAAVANAL